MALAMWYWLCMFLALVGGAWGFYPPDRRGYAPFAFLIWLAVLFQGLAVFKGPIK